MKMDREDLQKSECALMCVQQCLLDLRKSYLYQLFIKQKFKTDLYMKMKLFIFFIYEADITKLIVTTVQHYTPKSLISYIYILIKFENKKNKIRLSCLSQIHHFLC
jgi:hypothetical protein